MTTNIVKILFAALMVVFISIGTTGSAQAVTLTFDELSGKTPTSANGLTIEGVTFDFKINGVQSNDVIYNPPFPDVNHDGVRDSKDYTRYIAWPAMDGNADGILTMDFTKPVSTIKFGVGLPSSIPVSQAFTIELFDTDLHSLGTTVLDGLLQPDSPNKAAENNFSYTGTPVKRLLFRPNGNFKTFTPSRTFSLDNLTFIPAST